MNILSFGFNQPELTDQGYIVFPALEANWQKVNDHNHDGLNSAKISPENVLPLQTGKNGQFLTTNGVVSSWATLIAPSVDSLIEINKNGLTSAPYLFADFQELYELNLITNNIDILI
jgi:hypothetical protein